MKKIAYLMMAICAMTFVSCNKDDGKEEGKKEPPKEEARLFEDFEDGGILTWAGNSGAKFEIVANPSKTGVNTSAMVGKYTTADKQWHIAYSTYFGVSDTKKDPDFVNFTNDGYVFKVDCYAPEVGMKIYFKLEKDGGNAEVKNVVTTKANEWETLEYDFEPLNVEDGVFRNAVICADAGNTRPDLVIYFDNIRQVQGE